MKKTFFMALLLLMAFLQKSAAQVSEKDKSMFVDHYAYKYDPESLRQLLSKPEKVRVLQSCIRSIKDTKARKEISDSIEGNLGKNVLNFGPYTDLDNIYKNIGLKINNEYSRKLMPAFNLNAYKIYRGQANVFSFKLDEPTLGSQSLYLIDRNAYSKLINAYSKDVQSGFTDLNTLNDLTFAQPELLELLKNKIKVLEREGKLFRPDGISYDYLVLYWMKSLFYLKMKEDVLARLNEDIISDQKNMRLCDNLLAELDPKPAGEKDGDDLVFKEITDKGEVTVIPTDNKNTGNNPPKTEEKKNNLPVSPDWAGVYEDRGKLSTITISGSPAFYNGNFEYQNGDSKGTGGNLDSVKVNGNTMTGKWTVTHEDKTKKGQREGTFEIHLTADGIQGVMNETKDPMWQYNEGYSKENVYSSMGAGKSFTVDSVRK